MNKHPGRRLGRHLPMLIALVASAFLLITFGRAGSDFVTSLDAVASRKSRTPYRRQGLETASLGQDILTVALHAGTATADKQTIDDSFREPVGVEVDPKPVIVQSKQQPRQEVASSTIKPTQPQLAAAAAHVDTRPLITAATEAESDEQAALEERQDRETEDYEEDGDSPDYDYEVGKEEASPLVDASVAAAQSIARTAPFNATRFPKDLPFVEALATCDTLKCLHDAHYQPKNGARFNYPDFFIIGFQKTATTSIYSHMTRHKNMIQPTEKEPEVLTTECNFDLTKCPPDQEKSYVRDILRMSQFVEHQGRMPTFEASTHIVRGEGDLERWAAQMKEYFPWAKLVASVREPISRAISMLVHIKDKQIAGGGCLAKASMAWCLLNKSQITQEFNPNLPTNYSYPLGVWMGTWPREQFFLIQYEELTSEAYEQPTLHALKSFIGVDPNFPLRQELPLVNSRKYKISPEGYAMKRAEYEALVAIVRPDAVRLMGMVEAYKLGDGPRWLANWEAVWEKNLATCDDNDNCLIQLS